MRDTALARQRDETEGGGGGEGGDGTGRVRWEREGVQVVWVGGQPS